MEASAKAMDNDIGYFTNPCWRVSRTILVTMAKRISAWRVDGSTPKT